MQQAMPPYSALACGHKKNVHVKDSQGPAASLASGQESTNDKARGQKPMKGIVSSQLPCMQDMA